MKTIKEKLNENVEILNEINEGSEIYTNIVDKLYEANIFEDKESLFITKEQYENKKGNIEKRIMYETEDYFTLKVQLERWFNENHMDIDGLVSFNIDGVDDNVWIDVELEK